MLITRSKNNRVERFEGIKEFMDEFIAHLRYKESQLDGYKILYDSYDIEKILDSIFQADITSECEFSDFDEDDMPF